MGLDEEIVVYKGVTPGLSRLLFFHVGDFDCPEPECEESFPSMLALQRHAIEMGHGPRSYATWDPERRPGPEEKLW